MWCKRKASGEYELWTLLQWPKQRRGSHVWHHMRLHYFHVITWRGCYLWFASCVIPSLLKAFMWRDASAFSHSLITENLGTRVGRWRGHQRHKLYGSYSWRLLSATLYTLRWRRWWWWWQSGLVVQKLQTRHNISFSNSSSATVWKQTCELCSSHLNAGGDFCLSAPAHQPVIRCTLSSNLSDFSFLFYYRSCEDFKNTSLN